nr:hypothetical protein CFP56_17634 [Quercus suber]
MEQQNLNPDFPKQLSIASLFLAYNSDTETDDSSESNEIPPKLALYSNFIMSFYLARSQSDSSSSENYEIIPTDPLLPKSPTCIIRKDSFEFLMRKSSSSALSNGIPRIFSHSKKRKIHTVILFSSQVSVSSENDEIIQIRPTRHTILATSFKGLMGIVGGREFPLKMLAPLSHQKLLRRSQDWNG